MTEHQDIISQIKNHLDHFATEQSDYELKNFILDQHPTPARKLLSIMQQIEMLEKEVTTYDITGDYSRDIKLKTKQLNKLLEWYKTVDNPEQILMNFENEEPSYWANIIGRQAAIEILSHGNTTKNTMDKMSMLPLDDFEEAVRTCVKFASLIKTITQNVEEELSNNDAFPSLIKT